MGGDDFGEGQPVDDAGTTRNVERPTTEPPRDAQWFALFVRTGSEESVRRQLSYLDPGLQVLLPIREMIERCMGRERTVRRPLLPGYLFVRTVMDEVLYFRIRSLAHVLKILGQRASGAGRLPTPVPAREMEIILRLTRGGDLITFSRVHCEGQTVKVASGPLVGLEGVIVGVNRRKHRVRIRISLEEAVHVIDIAAEFVDDPD